MQVHKISYLDGKRLKDAIIAGTKIVERMQEQLNKINVFPVPDGDTGTNMASTLNQISMGLLDSSERSISDVSSTLAEAALMGAQGNSGAILAQFFHGFAESVKDHFKLSTAAFAEAVQNAKRRASEALSEPKEGTIITVISDWANYIEKTSHKTEDFSVLLKSGLHKAKKSLADTPKKLEVLKKAGVVDAGAQGFVHLLEGIVNFIDRGKLKKIYQEIKVKQQFKTATIKNVDSNFKFRYCTECMITGEEIDRSQLQNALSKLGDSLIVAGGTPKVRIHIHTDTPDQVFNVAKEFGFVSDTKVDDMREQFKEYEKNVVVKKVGIVTDSSCDLPAEFIRENEIHIIPLKLAFGREIFLDKVNITPIEFYDKLATSAVHPTTSQPSIMDIKQVFEKVVTRYEKIISIHLPRASSGTLQNIEAAAKMFDENKITCIDGKNISGALGLIIMEAVEGIKKNLSFEHIVERVKKSIEDIHIYITLPTVKYLVKGGRLSKPKGVLGRILRLNPIISFNKQGLVYLVAKSIGEKSGMKKNLRLTYKQAEKYKRHRFIVAHANAYAKAEWFVDRLAEKYNLSKKDIPIVDAATVLGVHAGPGTAGIAFMGYND